jgi:excinuclease ABC subunit C
MEATAANLDFEQAAMFRDRIASIEQVVERQRIIAPTLSDRDVVAVAREDGAAVAQVFFVRNGTLIGREYFQLSGTEDESDAQVLSSFIKQFYDEAGQVPGEIVVPDYIDESEIIERWLEGKRGTKVRIKVPKRGRKRELADVAVQNAAETLRALQVAHAVETEDSTASKAMEELQSALELPELPKRIECYDISTLQGTHTVGSMVVFENAAPAKADYRHFKIKTFKGQDDYAAMKEVLTRRFQRLARYRAVLAEAGVDDSSVDETGIDETGIDKNKTPGAFEKSPDLVLVDGGKGQLGVALRVLQDLGLDDIALASLAKREEEVFLPHQKVSVILPRDSQGLYLVQRARDEAHRFAITYNRKLRRKGGLRSSLDTVPGIGPKRRKALLVHFGSVDGIRNASVADLSAVPGMTQRAAEQLKAYL